MFIEAPTFICTRYFQLKIFFWFRILSRLWGRAWFYLFICILCFGEFEADNPAEFTIGAGFYLFIIALLSFIFSKLAANKLQRIFIYIAAGTEEDELETNLITSYKSLTSINIENAKLGSDEIHKIAKDAGRPLSNAERYCIQTYLDESCNGFISIDDWIKQFKRLTDTKQRFL